MEILLQSTGHAATGPLPTVFFIVFLVLAGILAIWAIRKALSSRRTKALENAATMIGFTFGGGEWPDKGRAPMLETALFGKGRARKVENIAFGNAAGFAASLFDYAYTIGAGRSQQTYAQTVAAFSRAGVSLPYFEMRPTNILARAWDTITHKNIQFEGNPEFAKRYVLRGALPEKVRGIFTPGLISFVEGFDEREKWHIEGADGTLVVYRLSKTVAPDKLRDFLDQTTAIASGFFSLSAQAVTVNTSN